ncbi:MAG TPA: NlpC/P60 family protein [Acidimicrobiales bacterium]
MYSVRRRGTSPFLALLASCAVIVLATVMPLDAPPSGAQSIAQTKAEIANLSAQLARQEKSSEVTANAFDAAKSELSTLTSNVITLQHREVATRVALATTTHSMVHAVLQSYVFDTSATLTVAVFNQDVTSSDARSVYQGLVDSNLGKLRVKLDRQRASLFSTITLVAQQRLQASAQTANLQSLLGRNIAASDQTRSTLTVVTAALKTQIIAYEVNAGAVAARSRDTAAESSAVAAASEVGGQQAANQVLAAISANTPPVITSTVSGSPAGSAAGELAVSYAEKEEGVPYVWGGETPGVGFDCSGLVQWAWAQAGYSMPRTTEEQWAALPHVALNALQPGDLLYYYNLDGDNLVDHVVMYVGSGTFGTNTIIAAPYTGTNVGLAPIFTFGLIGAARP